MNKALHFRSVNRRDFKTSTVNPGALPVGGIVAGIIGFVVLVVVSYCVVRRCRRRRQLNRPATAAQLKEVKNSQPSPLPSDGNQFSTT